MSDWQPIETCEVGKTCYLTDGKTVVEGKYLGPYRTGHSIEGRFGWFGLTHWSDSKLPLPAPPGESP